MSVVRAERRWMNTTSHRRPWCWPMRSAVADDPEAGPLMQGQAGVVLRKVPVCRVQMSAASVAAM